MKCPSPSAGIISHKDGGLWCLWAITTYTFGDLALLLERPFGCWGCPLRTAARTLTHHTLWLCPSRPATSLSTRQPVIGSCHFPAPKPHDYSWY